MGFFYTPLLLKSGENFEFIYIISQILNGDKLAAYSTYAGYPTYSMTLNKHTMVISDTDRILLIYMDTPITVGESETAEIISETYGREGIVAHGPNTLSDDLVYALPPPLMPHCPPFRDHPGQPGTHPRPLV